MGFLSAGYSHNEKIIKASPCSSYNCSKHSKYFPISITKQRLVLGVRSNKQYIN